MPFLCATAKAEGGTRLVRFPMHPTSEARGMHPKKMNNIKSKDLIISYLPIAGMKSLKHYSR